VGKAHEVTKENMAEGGELKVSSGELLTHITASIPSP
jgi:hypothetical protein